MRCDIFNQSDFIQHHNLWDEGNCFQPETVAPCEFPGSPAAVNEESHDEGCGQENHEMGEVIS